MFWSWFNLKLITRNYRGGEVKHHAEEAYKKQDVL